VNAWAQRRGRLHARHTESINLVAGSWGRANVRRGDTVVVTAMDHHSNIVPWQILCQEKGATLRMVEITEDGRIDLSTSGAPWSRSQNRCFSICLELARHGKSRRAAQQTCTRGGRGDGGTGRSPALTLRVDGRRRSIATSSAIRPQDARSHGKRGAGRQASAARGDAALPTAGGEMIERVWDDHSTWTRSPQVRRRDSERGSRRRARRRHRPISSSWDWTRFSHTSRSSPA